MKCVNIAKFPTNNVAAGQYNCIPATIHNILCFHQPAYQKNQKDVLDILTDDNGQWIQPSFDRAEIKSSSLSSDYSLEKANIESGYVDWVSKIREEIDNGYPVAVSTRQNDSAVHIRTVLGYDDENEYFLLFDTQSPTMIGPSFCGWISRFTIYKYADAENDYNSINSCKDILTIRDKIVDENQ